MSNSVKVVLGLFSLFIVLFFLFSILLISQLRLGFEAIFTVGPLLGVYYAFRNSVSEPETKEPVSE